MIEVTFHSYPDGRVQMVVCGHAGFGPRGQDIVCAAVSILTLAAERTAQELYLRDALRQVPETQLQEGFARICICPKPRSRQQARAALGVVHAGMQLLAQQFPECVRLKGRV